MQGGTSNAIGCGWSPRQRDAKEPSSTFPLAPPVFWFSTFASDEIFIRVHRVSKWISPAMIQHCIEKSNTEAWKFRTPSTPMFIHAEKPKKVNGLLKHSCISCWEIRDSSTSCTYSNAHCVWSCCSTWATKTPLANYFVCPFFRWINFLRHRVALGVSWNRKETPESASQLPELNRAVAYHKSSSIAPINLTSKHSVFSPALWITLNVIPNWQADFYKHICMSGHTFPITFQIAEFRYSASSVYNWGQTACTAHSSGSINLVLQREAKNTCLQIKAYG